MFSFQLYIKLFMILGMSWIVERVLNTIIIPNIPGIQEEATFIAGVIVYGLTFFGTAVLIFWIYVYQQSTLRKLKQKYTILSGT